MSKNNNMEPSPFHKKGDDEGDRNRNMMGRIFMNDYSKIEKDKYGIDELGGKVDKTFSEFQNIDVSKNLFAGAKNLMKIGDNFGQNKNQFEGLENTAEDLTVNQQQAQFQSEQGNQQRANILQGLKGSAGGSGVAGLAQAMANQGQAQTQQISASIGQQESQNQMAKASQAASLQQQQAQGQTNIDTARSNAAQATDMAMGQADMEAQKYRLQGAADARDLSLQQKQGELSFLAGQMESDQANKDADDAKKSDRRLKKNIIKIGESNKGLNIYSFEYKHSLDGEGLFQGVMSDEIPQEAVTSVDGYDRVNYNMLDVEFKQI